MQFTKPKDVSYEEIARVSGVSSRTIKRYAAGGNVTTANAAAIAKAIQTIDPKQNSKNKQHGSLVPSTQKEFFFCKSIFKHYLFWSSPVDKARDIDGVIEAYVKSPNLHDIYLLVRLFGAKRVLAVAKSVYLSILQEFGMAKSSLGTLPEYQTLARMVDYSLRSIR